MRWLLDTNVLSELRRPKPVASVVSFVASRQIEDLYIGVVTLAEIRFGVELVADPAKRAELNAWLNDLVRPMFTGRVLALDEEVLLKWRLLIEEGRKSRNTFSQPDLLIAATATCHGLTVVSRDRTHYDRARVPVLDPWRQPPA